MLLVSDSHVIKIMCLDPWLTGGALKIQISETRSKCLKFKKLKDILKISLLNCFNCFHRGLKPIYLATKIPAGN